MKNEMGIQNFRPSPSLSRLSRPRSRLNGRVAGEVDDSKKRIRRNGLSIHGCLTMGKAPTTRWIREGLSFLFAVVATIIIVVAVFSASLF